MTRIVIRAVPERGEFIRYLTDRLPDAEIVMDRFGDCLETLDRALAAAGTGPAVHMEDDVILTRDFRTKLEAVIAEMPHVVVQFFSMRSADLTVGSRWDSNYLMFQCTYMPAGYSSAFREYVPNRPAAIINPPGGMDTAFRHFLKGRRERYWIHVPSLVDHRVAKSVIDRRRSSKRQAFTFRDPWE